MNATISFDTLAYAKKLIAAGFTQQQVEVQAEALAGILDDKLSTKQDLRELEYCVLLRVGGMLAATIAISVSLVKLL